MVLCIEYEVVLIVRDAFAVEIIIVSGVLKESTVVWIGCIVCAVNGDWVSWFGDVRDASFVTEVQMGTD